MPALVTLLDPRSPAAEAYRTLRTNIHFGSLERPVRTLLVAGTGADEDAGATACNLAVTLAQSGTNTIVVDCDVRRPSVHALLDVSNDKGLATALLDQKLEELPLQQTTVPGLRVLPAGPPPLNPADLLATKKMRGVIQALAASAEMVVLAAAPVSLVADTAMLASQTDGVLLVVTAGKTRREVAARARATLEKVNARVLGVVLENARVDRALSEYYRNAERVSR